MVIGVRETHLAMISIAIMIGYQLSVYFLYQFKRNRQNKINLNRILLSYGLFFGTAITGVLIRIIRRYYITSDILDLIFSKVSMLLLISSLIVFILPLTSKLFDDIINHKYPLIMFFFAIGTLFLIIFFEFSSILTSIFLGITFSSITIFILSFHLKILKLSTGTIKKRQRLILIGSVIFLISPLIGGENARLILFPENPDILVLITVPILIFSMMIIFLGAYRFPAFLEFEWRENLIQLFVLEREEQKYLYFYDFTTKTSDSEDKSRVELMSGGIIGVQTLSYAITENQNKKIEKVKQGDSYLLFEYSDYERPAISYALLVKNDMNSARFFIREIKKNFQIFFKGILTQYGELKGEIDNLFKSFDIILRNLVE